MGGMGEKEFCFAYMYVSAFLQGFVPLMLFTKGWQ
jgi:hypothetical protein